jgi:hypothetical protein
MAQTPVNVFGSFMQGRQARLGEETQQRRNALMDMDLERERQFNTLSRDPNATPDQYSRMGRTDVGNALMNSQRFSQEQQVHNTKMLNAAAAEVAQNPAAASRWLPQLQQAGVLAPNVDISTIPPQQLQQMAKEVFESTSVALQALSGAPKEQAGFSLSPGQSRFDASGKLVASVDPEAPKPTTTYRELREDELKKYGLPVGTAAQIDTTTNKVDVINKREGLSTAEQKTIRDAKMRMPRIAATERRVTRLGQAVAALSKNKAFDGGPVDARVLQYTKDGREVMAAQSQLVAELTALTRVPGIGSQSDLETRLASLAMPSLEMPPEVNAKSQAELEAFIADLRAAYESLAAGGDGMQASPTASGGPAVGVVEDGYRFKGGNPSDPDSWERAR